MPSDNDHSALTNDSPDGEALPSFARPTPAGGSHTPKTAQALVDGVGVYTASLSSPFLTVPPGANGGNGASPAPALSDGDGADPLTDELRELAEPLKQKVQSVPLRLRLSEEELSGVVAAVLDFIARYLPIAARRAEQKR